MKKAEKNAVVLSKGSRVPATMQYMLRPRLMRANPIWSLGADSLQRCFASTLELVQSCGKPLDISMTFPQYL